MKSEYTTLMDEKLYEKWEITEANGRSKNDCSVEFAYITFRSMAAKDRAMQALEFA